MISENDLNGQDYNRISIVTCLLRTPPIKLKCYNTIKAVKSNKTL